VSAAGSSGTSARVALLVQYWGTHFHGWQRQPQQRTVQAVLEQTIGAALDALLPERELRQQRVTVVGAGRTDAGVHAAAQVAHFDVRGPIPAAKWAAILNARLPQDLLVRDSAAVPPHWHARFSAIWRRYRYLLYTAALPDVFLRPLSWHYYAAPLRADRMQAALRPLVGRRCLRAFHRAGSARPHSWVEVQAAECHRHGAVVALELQASGFLYGMVRLLVGMLVEVGSGQRSPESFTELWIHRQRGYIQYAAPAQGLCLLRVGYPEWPFSPQAWLDAQPALGWATGSPSLH